MVWGQWENRSGMMVPEKGWLLYGKAKATPKGLKFSVRDERYNSKWKIQANSPLKVGRGKPFVNTARAVCSLDQGPGKE